MGMNSARSCVKLSSFYVQNVLGGVRLEEEGGGERDTFCKIKS